MKKKNLSSVPFNLKAFVFLSLFFTISSVTLFAGTKSSVVEIMVSNQSELNAAIDKARPGENIILKDGDWENVVVNFKANATEGHLITLRAQTPGKVIFKGNSKIAFLSPYLVVDGLLFKDGSIDTRIVINFKSEHCALINTAIIDYNPPLDSKGYFWVYFAGSYNRVSNCYFRGKNNADPLINNGSEGARHNAVDHCHFTDVPKSAEMLRIWGYGGNEDLGDDGAFMTVEYNLFERIIGDGAEIISFKSNHNIARFNTIRASQGGIVGRSGNYNTFEGNIILGENAPNSAGIRVAGQFHKVVNNYVSDVAKSGLSLMTGDYFEKALNSDYKPVLRTTAAAGRVPRYSQVKNGIFTHNTIVSIGGVGIDISSSYKSRWPASQLVLLPENNEIANNLIVKCKEAAISIPEQDTIAPLDFLKFQPNRFNGNIVFDGEVKISHQAEGIRTVDPQLHLCKDSLYRPSKMSPIASGVVNKNINEKNEKNYIGFDESDDANLIRHPLTASEVGPKWLNK